MIATTRILAGCLALVSGACATAVQAQSARQNGALSQLVNSISTETPLQQQAAYAVQGMCTALGAAGGLSLPDGPDGRRDLFLRCNEMVETARAFQGIPLVQQRPLGYSDVSQLLAAIQQVSGEEIAAQGDLSTQVSAGQFANIGGRLSALRFGGAAAASRGRVAALGAPSREPGARQSYASLLTRDARSAVAPRQMLKGRRCPVPGGGSSRATMVSAIARKRRTRTRSNSIPTASRPAPTTTSEAAWSAWRSVTTATPPTSTTGCSSAVARS